MSCSHALLLERKMYEWFDVGNWLPIQQSNPDVRKDLGEKRQFLASVFLVNGSGRTEH